MRKSWFERILNSGIIVPVFTTCLFLIGVWILAAGLSISDLGIIIRGGILISISKIIEAVDMLRGSK